MASIVLSIKPKYAERILDGFKKYEFRKLKPQHQVHRIFIYASSPKKKIVGSFQVIRIVSDSPVEIWKKCGSLAGIDKDEFFSYCGDKKIIHGFEIGYVKRFDPPIDPFGMNWDFKAPQNFVYVKTLDEKDLIERRGLLLCQNID